MAIDVLAIPISIVALDSTFCARGRVVDTFIAFLNPNTVQALICEED